MSENNGAGTKPDVEALRAEIKQTRAELGETVQALAAKADVKARAKEQVEHTKQRVKDAAAQAGERVRSVAGQASDQAHRVADQASSRLGEDGAGADDVDVVVAGRGRAIPAPLLVAGAVALVGVILIVRGWRR